MTMAQKRPYNKSATTYAEQLERLKNRGMAVADEAEAVFYLEHLNYYRLRGYWLFFEADYQTHQFRPDTSFTDVLNLYRFDRELRLLVLDAIERIEVSVRAHWAYEMGHRYGSHGYLDPDLAYRHNFWESNLEALAKEVHRSDELFIRHLRNTYNNDYPPVWAVCEVMSLGLLSRWYDNIKPMATRKAIARPYGLTQPLLTSWLRHLTGIRNLCAHHARLWNREFVVTPMLPPADGLADLHVAFHPGSRRLYNTLVILLYWMDRLSPHHEWRKRLCALLSAYNADLSAMGFPANWPELPIWSNAQ